MRAKCRKCKNLAMLHGNHGLCSKHYRRLLNYRGGPRGWVDTESARNHISILRKRGMPMRRIAEVVGVNETSIHRIANGKNKYIRRATEEKILAIESPHEVSLDVELSPVQRVLATGTIRRLRALTAMGYSQPELATRLGVKRTALYYLVSGRRTHVHARTAERVKRLFDDLQMQVPPETPQVKRTKAFARKNGWVPPLAWDEDAIDDPKAKPCIQTATLERRGELPDWYEQFQYLKEQGLTNAQIADRFGIHRTSLQIRLAKIRAAA